MKPVDKEQITFLSTLLGGERPCQSFKGEISGVKVAGLIRRRLTEWVRRNDDPVARAVAIKITDDGRSFLASNVNPSKDQ